MTAHLGANMHIVARIASFVLSLVYLGAGIGFTFYPLDAFGEMSVFMWFYSDIHVGGLVWNVLMILAGSVGFMSMGIGCLLLAFRRN